MEIVLFLLQMLTAIYGLIWMSFSLWTFKLIALNNCCKQAVMIDVFETLNKLHKKRSILILFRIFSKVVMMFLFLVVVYNSIVLLCIIPNKILNYLGSPSEVRLYMASCFLMSAFFMDILLGKMAKKLLKGYLVIDC